jgi:biopolymer transport protein ExbD
MGMASRGKGDINITPMIDVLLVLIIIFMVITPLTPKGLKTLLPEPPSRQREMPVQSAMVLTLQKNGGLLLNRERVASAALPERLTRIFRTHGDEVLFVRADGDLEFGKVAEVIDTAKGAGLRRVALMSR